MVLSYFRALDNIVNDAARIVANVSTDSYANSPVIVGGMAIQLHCLDYPDLLRSTSDLDVFTIESFANRAAFMAGFGDRISRGVREAGYQVQVKKSRNSYTIFMMDGQNSKAKQLFLINFDYSSPKNHERTKHVSERRASNAVYLKEKGLHVVRIEDIIPHKLKRLRGVLRRLDRVENLTMALYEDAEDSKWTNLAGVPLGTWLELITIEQNRFTDAEKRRSPSLYVVSKDLYDIALLSRVIEGTPGSFNKAYYLDAKSQIDAI